MCRYLIIGLGLLVGLGAARGGEDAGTGSDTSAANALQLAASAEEARPATHIVPQLQYDPQGLVDPTGRFAVARASRLVAGLLLVDIKRQQVAWCIEPLPVERRVYFAFSRDGRRLAICSPNGGQMIDLVAGRVTMMPWLKGLAPVFSPDDELLYVAASAEEPQGAPLYVQVYNLHGQKAKSYALQMNMVGRLSFSKDAKTLIVDGGTGAGFASKGGGTFTRSRQTIDLDTGDSASLEFPDAQESPGVVAADAASFDAMNFSEIPGPKVTPRGRGSWPMTTFAQQLTNVLWDASTNSLVVIGRGQPEGGVIKLWNLSEGTFSKTAGKDNEVRNVALQGPGLLVGTARNVVTLIQLPGGEARPLASSARDWTQYQPSPNGRHLAGLIGQFIQVWDTQDCVLVGEISDPRKPIRSFQWTADGRFLIVRLTGQDGRDRWEFFTPQGKYDGAVPEEAGWDISFSPSGDLVAVQAKETWAGTRTDSDLMSVGKSRTGEHVATIEGGPPAAERLFLDEQRLLLAGRRPDSPIQLVRISDQRVLWETKAVSDVRSLSWQPGLTSVVIRYAGPYEGADVLSIEDGQRLPAEAEGPAGHNPPLFHGGRRVLDPLCGSTVLQLKETATGRTVATLAAFADPEWIIYTPEGTWTGSPKALEWVAFYRGTEPLTDAEINALRQPDAVKARLAEALR